MLGESRSERPQAVIGIGDAEPGRDALALGVMLADRLGIDPVAAKVVPYPRALLGPAELDRSLEALTADLARFARAELGGREVRAKAFAERSPAQALQGLAAGLEAKLIVVGPARRHRGHGAIATSLMHGAPCAVAVAPPGYADGARRLDRIAVAFDGSPEAWPALETGIELARSSHALLTVITVAEAPADAFVESLDGPTADRVFSAAGEEARSIIDLGMARVPDAVAADARLVDGHPAERVVELAADSDLLLLGSRGYGPLRRTLLGSVSGEVVATARCPVLVLPRAAGIDPLGVLEPPGPARRQRVAA